MVERSKYYYDYTRNMSYEDQIKNSICGRPDCCCAGNCECQNDNCLCTAGFDEWVEERRKMDNGFDVLLNEIEKECTDQTKLK